jgi:hypothetical protein
VNDERKALPGLMSLACGIFLLSVIFEILSSRGLYADGAYGFIRVLQAQGFVAMFWLRQFSFYIFEFPLVLAIKLGVTNFTWLRLAYGLGCFLPWPIVLTCCYWISPKNFWLAAAGCAAGYLNTAFMTVGGHVYADLLFWPSLFVLLFATPLRPVTAIILLVSATGILFDYESQVFLCSPLALLALWRAYMEKKAGHRWTWIAFLIAAALFIASVSIGLYGILMPENPANFSGFKANAVGIVRHMGWPMSWTLAWIALALAASFSETFWRIVSSKFGIHFLLLLLLLWGMWPLLAPNHWDNGVQYDNRIMDMLAPLGLLPVALILRFRPQWIEPKRKRLEQFAAAMFAAQSLWQISATVHWCQDVIWMREILATHQGIIPLHSTALAADGMGGRELRPNSMGGRFDWTWPCLSLALCPDPKIKSFVCSEVFLDAAIRAHYWQPFDPLDPKTLPNLQHFRVDYSNYISAISTPLQKQPTR